MSPYTARLQTRPFDEAVTFYSKCVPPQRRRRAKSQEPATRKLPIGPTAVKLGLSREPGQKGAPSPIGRESRVQRGRVHGGGDRPPRRGGACFTEDRDSHHLLLGPRPGQGVGGPDPCRREVVGYTVGSPTSEVVRRQPGAFACGRGC